MPEFQNIVEFLQSNMFTSAAIDVLICWIAFLVIGKVIEFLSGVMISLLAIPLGPTAAFYMGNYLTFIGTVHHEFSHALVALLTGARVTRISLIPQGMQLGCVEFKTSPNPVLRAVQLVLTSAAPVICGAASLFLMHNYLLAYCREGWQAAVYWYVFISIFVHMSLSGQDIRNILRGSPVCLLIVYGIVLIYRFETA